MFVTYEEHRAPFLNLFGDDLTHWKTAELAFHRLWFLVSLSQFEPPIDGDSFGLNRTMLISKIADVEELAQMEATTNQLQLDSVMIVTPGHVNGTNRWKMEPLRAVWRAEEPSAPGQVDVYETAEGVMYVDSGLDIPPKRLRKKILRCTFPLQQ